MRRAKRLAWFIVIWTISVLSILGVGQLIRMVLMP